MSQFIDKAFVQQFGDTLIHLFQQKESRLLPHVTVKKIVGKYTHFERLGLVEASERLTRHQLNQYIDTPHSRRRVILRDFEVSDLIDKQDEMRMVLDPKGPYMRNFSMALGRQADSLIYAAAIGDSTDVDEDDTGSTVALPAGQIVDQDVGGVGTGLNLDKLIEAKRILMANEVPMDEPLVCVCNAKGIAELLSETEVTSSDYAAVKALVRGEIDTFMGFKFIHYERLSNTASGADHKAVLVFAKSALGVAMASDVQVKAAESPERGFSTIMQGTLSMNAVRIQDEGVVVIEADQGA